MKLEKKKVVTREELLNEVKNKVDKDVVFVTAGAGDIDAMLQDLKKNIEV